MCDASTTPVTVFNFILEKFFHFFLYHIVIVEPLLKDEMAEDYLWEVLNPILVEALSMVIKRNNQIS